MAIKFIENSDGWKVLYDSTTMEAFGPVFYNDDDLDDFIEYCDEEELSPFMLSDEELDAAVDSWRKESERISFCCGAEVMHGICLKCKEHI